VHFNANEDEGENAADEKMAVAKENFRELIFA
jgi:hypothetical protein